MKLDIFDPVLLTHCTTATLNEDKNTLVLLFGGVDVQIQYSLIVRDFNFYIDVGACSILNRKENRWATVHYIDAGASSIPIRKENRWVNVHYNNIATEKEKWFWQLAVKEARRQADAEKNTFRQSALDRLNDLDDIIHGDE